ncbi:hypothetical protein VTK56DRAFT_4088 [Thermocarpiscus australiensis]
MLPPAIVRQRVGTSVPAARPAANIIQNRFRRLARPAFVQQRRNVAELPGKTNPDNLGGPGGQEIFPASRALRKQFRKNTLYGVLLACTVMAVAKMARWNSDPNAAYVLVHDSAKGELDDVKYIKAPELAKEKRNIT